MGKIEIEEAKIYELLGAIPKIYNQLLGLYIPNKDKKGRKVKNYKKWVKEGLKILTIIGGGATAFPPSDGTWLDEKKYKAIGDIDQLKDEDIIWEETVYMYTYIDGDRFLENISILRKFLHDFGRITKQGEVVFSFHEEFFKIINYDN